MEKDKKCEVCESKNIKSEKKIKATFKVKGTGISQRRYDIREEYFFILVTIVEINGKKENKKRNMEKIERSNADKMYWMIYNYFTDYEYDGIDYGDQQNIREDFYKKILQEIINHVGGVDKFAYIDTPHPNKVYMVRYLDDMALKLIAKKHEEQIKEKSEWIKNNVII